MNTYIIRSVFTTLIGKDNLEYIQLGSRIDRGVHALFNTFHVDVRPRTRKDMSWDTKNLHKGTIIFVCVDYHILKKNEVPMKISAIERRLLSIPNPIYIRNNEDESKEVDWNARFVAFERTNALLSNC